MSAWCIYEDETDNCDLHSKIKWGEKKAHFSQQPVMKSETRAPTLCTLSILGLLHKYKRRIQQNACLPKTKK